MQRTAKARPTEIPETEGWQAPFDFVLDEWDPKAAQLQTTGDLILVALPRGFYGGIVVRSVEDWSGIVSRFCS